MITVHTCPTSALEKLAREFDQPKTFTESVILRGANAEIASRSAERSGEADSLRDDFEESEREVARLTKELEEAEDKISELEKNSGVDQRVESALI